METEYVLVLTRARYVSLTLASSIQSTLLLYYSFNLLKHNVNYSGRTAPLTSKVAFYIFIKQI